MLSISLCLTLIYACKTDHSNVSNNHFELDHHQADLKWGYIDLSGKERIKAVYDDVRDFADGLAAVNSNPYWGYIDKTGKIVIDCIFKTAKSFIDGRAIVQNQEDEWMLINSLGEVLVNFVDSKPIQTTREHIIPRSNSGIGLVSFEGDTIIDFSASSIIPTNGLGTYFIKDQNGWRLSRENQSAKTLEVDEIYSSSQSLHKFASKGYYGFISTSGEMSIAASYSFVSDFTNGKAFVCKQDQCFIIDQQGQPLHKLDVNTSFHSPGYVLTSSNSGLSLKDFDLNIVVGGDYDLIYRPSSGLVGLMKDDLWSFYGIDSSCYTGLKYPLVWEANNGYGRFIKMRQGIGFVDQNCNEILKARYYEVKDFHEGLARYQKLPF